MKIPATLLLMVHACLIVSANAARADEKSEVAKRERTRVLKEMHGLADQIMVTTKEDNKFVERVKEPIFRFNSPSRLYQDGSIWAWGKRGRPLVVMEMFTINTKQATWVHGFVLASDELVEAKRLDEKVWYPEKLGVETKPFADAPDPADNPVARLRQMKQLSRRFSAHQFWGRNNTKFDLRLLVRHVHRYSDPQNGLIDGSMYLMAHEIEPEVIIMIEAVESGGRMRWQYAVTPIGSAEFHIFLDEKKIYQRERTPKKTGYPTDPYHSFHPRATRE